LRDAVVVRPVTGRGVVLDAEDYAMTAVGLVAVVVVAEQYVHVARAAPLETLS
jgi:hypothetical protein